jgi:hypothetical protein
MSRFVKSLSLVFACALLAGAPTASGQELASIAGVVKDTSGGVLPGVTVEIASPALIEKVRTTTTDANGAYRVAGLPVGTYTVTFVLTSFNSVQHSNVLLSSGLTAAVNAELGVGNLREAVVVEAQAATIDVQSARQVTVFSGDDLKDLPAVRNVSNLMNLVPGITMQTGLINSAGGVCVGGVGVWCSPNVYSFNAHSSQLDADGLRQGRLMVDGMVLNTASNTVTGVIGGYIADVTNAQEVSFSLSGALGESETGGTSINIVPRTGGNRYAGTYYTHYTQKEWFDKNDGTHKGNPVTGAPAAQAQHIIHEHDVTGSFGGPIRRDALWFYATARTQRKEASTADRLWPNRNSGIWGKNYQPDRSVEPLNYMNMWNNASTRITWQAKGNNKFNLFWDEQDSCQDPCGGSVATFWSPESQWSVHTYPNRVNQLRWTNPFTNRILLEGGWTYTTQHYNFTKHRYYENPQDIPRIQESGTTVGLDETATRFNNGQSVWSGSISSGNLDNLDNNRVFLSSSLVTGSHNAKIQYDGQFYSQVQNVVLNQPRLTFTYMTPGATCFNAANPSASTCGNTSLHFPSDPFNSVRRPVPTSVTIDAGDRTFDENVSTHSVFVQDQWTVKRFTLSGAIRYDHARSQYGETCIGPDIYVAVGYCTPAADGVRFHDITPRANVAWNVFGDGKTAVKFNVGRYLGAAGFQDVYTGANPARRTLNSMNRTWDDLNGNRMPDCVWTDAAEHTTLGDRCGNVGAQTMRRFGKDPYLLDETGDAIGLNTTHCGRTEKGIPQAVLDYCGRADQNLLSGYGKRRSEWQFGFGVQREILPRLSAEVTYNQRWYRNQENTDTIGVGCDLYGADTEACIDGMMNYTHPQYSFYSFRAPLDPRLPDGGGYLINGLSNRSTATAPSGPDAITRTDYYYGWRGIDTNFVYRARGGFRINGGTSTGKSVRNICTVMDSPDVRMREGGHNPSCEPWRPWQTNVRGSASYTIPWIDVLTSVTFQSRPGTERSANVQFTYRDAIWAPGSEWRATNTAGCPTTGANAAPVGCFYGVNNNNNITTNVLDFSDLWGERISLADVKFAKNFRFQGRRLNVGVDVYNVTNSDAVTSYQNTYTLDNPNTPDVELNQWGNPTGLIAPRFARVTVQFDF